MYDNKETIGNDGLNVDDLSCEGYIFFFLNDDYQNTLTTHLLPLFKSKEEIKIELVKVGSIL